MRNHFLFLFYFPRMNVKQHKQFCFAFAWNFCEAETKNNKMKTLLYLSINKTKFPLMKKLTLLAVCIFLLIANCLLPTFSFSQYIQMRNRSAWKSPVKPDTTSTINHQPSTIVSSSLRQNKTLSNLTSYFSLLNYNVGCVKR